MTDAMEKLHDFTVETIDGGTMALEELKGKTLLVVNVASRCGLTPHYEGLERLYRRYKDRGFSVLGFPCNQFGAQEPGTHEEIKAFCNSTYDVTFPLFAKVDVNGDKQAEVYRFLTSQQTTPDGPGDIVWNFAKFVVGGDGQVLARFGPQTEPEAEELVGVIEKALA